MFNVPNEMLNDRFEYQEYVGIDRSHTPEYKEPLDIESVRIDRVRKYYRDSSESGIRAEATIFCYASGTKPFIQFKEKSKVVFDNESYIIRNVKPLSDVYTNELAVVQLEVI